MLRPEPGGEHEAAGISKSRWWHSGSVAARGARAAGERMRRIGVLMGIAADDRDGQARLAAFRQGLQQLGWTEGGNSSIDIAGAQATRSETANMRRN